MKLIRQVRGAFTFRVMNREKELLFHILNLYPLVPPAHHQLSDSIENPQQEENQRLLDEALSDHRKENRKRLLAMLNEPTCFRQSEKGFNLTLTRAQMEWLLQVFNDLRVGAWLALGKPDDLDRIELDKTNEPYVLTLEAAGYFEMSLLAALESCEFTGSSAED